MKDGRQGVLLRNIQLGSSGVIFGGLAVWIFDGNKIRRQVNCLLLLGSTYVMKYAIETCSTNFSGPIMITTGIDNVHK